MAALEQELLEQFKQLTAEQQKAVLDFVHRLRQPRGEPGRELIERTSHIRFPKEDLEEIKRYVEEYEERIDWDDWNNPPAVFD